MDFFSFLAFFGKSYALPEGRCLRRMKHLRLLRCFLRLPVSTIPITSDMSDIELMQASKTGSCSSETLSIGDRVTHPEFGVGTVLGFRKQNGERVGDTSGGLTSKGCVRIDFKIRGPWNVMEPLQWESSSAVRPIVWLAFS